MQESEDEGESLQTDAMIKVSTIRSGVSAPFSCSLVMTCGSVLSAAEEVQGHQADKGEGRFWETPRQGESQDQEVNNDGASTKSLSFRHYL